MFHRFLRIQFFLMLSGLIISCLPYYLQGLGGETDERGCKHNPYIYEEFPKEWLTWEKIHWDVSCFQQKSENTTPYGMHGGYIGGHSDQQRIRTEHRFGESNPFVRFY